jgi:biopolymer transport protein TolR
LRLRNIGYNKSLKMKHFLRKPKLVTEINITPFTDVILVLLIIFMIATPLLSQPNLKVTIPSAKNTKAASESRKVNITINNQGVIYLEKEPVTKEELQDGVKILHKNNPQIHVLLVIDEKAIFKDISKVLDVLSGAQIEDVNIAVSQEK